MSVAISVVVPTFRRPEMLARCLQALLAQDLAPSTFEIVVVDDAASKETRLQVEGFARQGSHQLFYQATSGACGPATARNLGWRVARGELIAFTDDDCIPEKQWLHAGMGAFTQGVAAVTGRIRVPLPADPSDYEYDTSHLEESEFATANCFYQRSVLMELGGFDERFRAAWREDSDLFFKLIEHQRGFQACNEAVVVHPVRPARWGISLSQQRKSMFNALLYKKHPGLYRERIQARPNWLYYLSTAALLAVLGGLIGRLWLISLLALLLWGILTIRFCLQRLHHTSHRPGHVFEMLITSALIPPLALFWRIRGMIRFRVFFL